MVFNLEINNCEYGEMASCKVHILDNGWFESNTRIQIIGYTMHYRGEVPKVKQKMYYQGEKILVKRYDPEYAEMIKNCKMWVKEKLVKKLPTLRDYIAYEVLTNFKR